DYVIDWENDALKLKNYKDNGYNVMFRNKEYYFKPSITWSDITSGNFAMRFRTGGSIHDATGMSAFIENFNSMKILLGLLNTKFANFVLNIINPTMHMQIGDVSSFPVILSEDKDFKRNVIYLVDNAIELAKKEWDSFENSWE